MRTGSPRSQTGFTLVEIAIVLVIIGLILGGVLKGQELVTSARVRNIADQQNAIKAAFFAFQDRYKALPGDYSAADANIPGLPNGSSTVDGDGDGFVAYTAGSPNAPAAGELKEEVLAFLHLTASGFISCSQCITALSSGASGLASPTQGNSPVNAYGGVLSIAYDANFGSAAAAATGNPFNNVKTGANIPSNVLAEVDNKLDDGNPYTGNFQFSPYNVAGAAAPTVAACLVQSATTSTVYNWARQTPSTNCGAAYTF